ncbi:hypothetical protein U0033_06285 [Chitinophaga sancti]|uniref:Uncharacterized protein n=1 Tax=Chitinophaga sancti TaxID=1004 RepID=A0A1K1RX93_9BACT|nr:hypothetical protein [Chitinophaga sancti]WQD63997.1 hypothetical protein U0033_06285 [Chitinophaga sancti]WQG90379.1 hypothetical protein SR876_02635 [Chitinophaga sancti]SFW76407.1 hypothetical protein SAMN05661012_04348 [Chitinophaga sancti]
MKTGVMAARSFDFIVGRKTWPPTLNNPGLEMEYMHGFSLKTHAWQKSQKVLLSLLTSHISR